MTRRPGVLPGFLVGKVGSLSSSSVPSGPVGNASRMGVSPGEFWNAADTDIATESRFIAAQVADPWSIHPESQNDPVASIQDLSRWAIAPFRHSFGFKENCCSL